MKGLNYYKNDSLMIMTDVNFKVPDTPILFLGPSYIWLCLFAPFGW